MTRQLAVNLVAISNPQFALARVLNAGVHGAQGRSDTEKRQHGNDNLPHWAFRKHILRIEAAGHECEHPKQGIEKRNGCKAILNVKTLRITRLKLLNAEHDPG